jgi:hypothetical protein
MGPQNWGHIIFNYFKTCFNKGDIYGEPEKSSLLKYEVAWHQKLRILRNFIRNYSVYGWLKGITLKSVPLFAFPSGIQLHLEKDAEKTGWTWAQLERLAHNRDGWRKLVGGLCSSEEDREKKEAFFFQNGSHLGFYYQLLPVQPN